MSFEHCHSCLPPVRHAGCHSDCPYYQADIAARSAAKEEKRRARKREMRTLFHPGDGRAETGLGRRCVVQSPIRTRRWGVGRESTSNRRGIRRNGCYAASGEDGYRLVPRLLLQRQICNHQFRAWEIKVRRRKEQCPIPKHGCDFSPPRESATLGRNVHEHRRTI